MPCCGTSIGSAADCRTSSRVCGVVAFVDLTPNLPPVADAVVRSAMDSLVHRGPDASGLLRTGGGKVVFGHRRLSIVNLGSDGDQPMTDASHRVAVTFNGEIYNHLELRRQLEQRGARFRSTNSDTEVLVHGYLHWGWTGLLERLLGMFAFVLWDDASRELFAARDRLGIKPLYYADVSGRLVLASEAKAIARLPDFPRRMNDIACLDLLNVLATTSPTTLFDGIFKMPAGTSLHVDASGRISRSRYWHAPGEPVARNIGFADAAAEVEHLARTAIIDRIPNEVRAGVLLSGGVDSGFVLGVAAAAGHNLKAYTASFPGDPLDESAVARETARYFGCEHVSVEIDEAQVMETTLTLMGDMDEPIADPACLPLQFLSACARKQGLKVALVGEGADELFCGYPAWRSFIHEQSGWRMVAAMHRNGMERTATKALQSLGARLPWARLGLIGAMDVASSVAMGHGRFRSGAESMRPMQIRRLLKRDWHTRQPAVDPACAGSGDFALNAPLHERLAQASGGYPDCAAAPEELFRNLRRRDIAFRLPELLLMRVDKITMASSIEARVPFLDHRLVEYVLRLPESVVLDTEAATGFGGAGFKPLLRAAASNVLPRSVVERKKIGLGAPMNRWLKGRLGQQLEEVVLEDARSADSPFCIDAVQHVFGRHRRGERDYSHYIWPIANIALWRRQWLRS